MLLDMARLGFGWAELPRQLVDSYSAGALHELRINGWPRRVAVDVVWSRQHALGPVAAWLLERLLADT
jgi:DNA-binding transcriptional LysR family regulator